MSSNKKNQNVVTDKKKISLFSSRKSKAHPENTAAVVSVLKPEPGAAAVEITDTAVNAAVLHSAKDDADKPSSSAKGKINKLTKFFKIGSRAAKNAEKDSRKIVVEVKQPPLLPETCAASISQCVAEVDALQKDDLSLKVPDGARTETEVENVDAEEVVNIDGEESRESAATKIQSAFRGHNERRKVLEARQNVVKVEAYAPFFLARNQVADMNASSDVTAEPPSEDEQPQSADEKPQPEDEQLQSAEEQPQPADEIPSNNLVINP